MFPSGRPAVAAVAETRRSESLGFAHTRLFEPDARKAVRVSARRRARDVLVPLARERLPRTLGASQRGSLASQRGTLAREVSLLAAPKTFSNGVTRAAQVRAAVRGVRADGVHQLRHRAPPVADYLREGLALLRGALLGAAERLQAPAGAAVADASRRARGEQSVRLRVSRFVFGCINTGRGLKPVTPVRPVRVELALGRHRGGARSRLLARALRRRSRVARLRGVLAETRPGGHPALAGARSAFFRRGGRARTFPGDTNATGGVARLERPLASVPVVVRGVIGRRPAATAVAFFGILPLLLLLLLVPLLVPLGFSS